MSELEDQLGQVDIYLFDQLLRKRIAPGMRVLDAGCGSGRNLVYLLKQGYEVFGADSDRISIQAVQRDAWADVVLSCAVLHFAKDDAHFTAMLRGTWRVLKPGGLMFCRLASSIGMEERVRSVAGRRCRLPDGTERYLVDAALLIELTRDLGGTLLDPLKTTIVQDQRSMTTWVLRKAAPSGAGETEPR